MNAKDLAAKGEAEVARSQDSAEVQPLLARKAVLMGIAATMGSVLDGGRRPLAVDSVTTKPPPSAPGRSSYVPKWAPSTAYVGGQQVISANNDVVSAKVAHTSGATYADDVAKWNLSRTYAGPADVGLNALKNGCAGNGVTDDTAALHAIRDAAANLGVPVFLPKGTYLVTTLALSVANQVWELAKGAVIKQKAETTTVGIVTITGAGVTFRGGKIDGDKTRQTYVWAAGISVQGANVTIDSVEVTKVFADGIVLMPTAVGCLVTNNYCHDNGKSTNAANGILLDGATRTRVIGNRCERNGTAGNEALYDGNGIYLAGGAVAGYNLIANNQCSYNARRGIKVQECGATVTGNVCVLNSCGIGVTVSPNPTNTPTVISGNMIKDSTSQGLQLDRCSFLTITGNTITDSGDHGVGAADGCNQVSFSGNTVARSARNGVNLAGVTDWNMSGNIVVDNGQSLVNQNRYGVVLENGHVSQLPCRNINIVGNTSQNTGTLNAQDHGFVIGGNSDKISLVGNCAEIGLIFPYSIGGSVTNLTMFGNRGGGVGFTSINLAPGASLDSDHATGFRIGSDNGRKIGFWGNTPVSQPAAPPADATDLATAIALVNDLKAKLKQIGLTA